MSTSGRVIGGAYLNSTVTTATFGTDLVVQSGFKGKKLTIENVASWVEVPTEAKSNLFGSIGKAAAGASLPGRFGKAASAAVGAAMESKKPPRTVLVDWTDGKQSLIELSQDLFIHFDLTLRAIRVESPIAIGDSTEAQVEATPGLADKAFDLVSGIVKDRFPARAASGAQELTTGGDSSDPASRLQSLAKLRDAGLISEEEFAAKKADLLDRM